MISKVLLTVLLFFLAGIDIMYAAGSASLSYTQPSKTWMGSLPLGNGRIGAMVYGGTAVETIALNEVTMWSGQPDPDCNNLCGPERLKEMRDAFLSGDIEHGNHLGYQNLSGHGRSFGTHLPFGDIVIRMQGHKGSDTNYSRNLDLANAVACIQYNNGGTDYTREYFTSNPDQVLAVRYTASKGNSINASVGMDMLRHSTVTVSGSEIDITGDARFTKNGEGGVKFRGIVKVLADGGSVTAKGGEIVVSGANSMTIIADIRTDFRNPGYMEQCRATVDNAVAKGYEAVRNAHTADFSSLFNRMSIELGDGKSQNMSTDEMFSRAHAGESLPTFDALFFQYGRYMQIASSRENSPLPSNLQGIWNDNLACNMPWTCDYHLDINIQQNYWSANIANLAETNTPLFQYMALLVEYGHETAKRMYGCDGWVAHTINNVWGDTAPGNGVSWAMNVTAGAWMMTHLWTHYEFTLDRDYLRNTAYPLLKETAKFFVDYMIEDPKTGWLLSGPSISPENGFKTADGKDFCLSMMPTIDRAVIYDIYNACIESARVLGIDDEFTARLKADIKRLPPMQIDDRGELREWLAEGVHRADPSHRHASHLVALYPFGQISPVKTPELAKACAVFLKNQTSNENWEDTEWTRGNNINFYARLRDGNKAYESLVGLYTGFMRENLMTVSPAGVAGAESDIFSFDATEAAVAGTCEMILQSYDGYLDFLPALPDAWNSGSITGVCARGAIEADVTWKNKKAVSIVLRSKVTQKVKCRVNGKMKTVSLKAGKSVKVI